MLLDERQKYDCNVCADTGRLLMPAEIPQGVTRQTHTWDEIRALAVQPPPQACRACARGKDYRAAIVCQPITT
jgi:hypothetical protein